MPDVGALALGVTGDDDVIAAVSIVRDEADIIGLTIAHLLEQGVDLILVADNGSTDSTRAVLAALSRNDERVQWTEDGSDLFLQAEIVTDLAREAWARGAEWILPFDADEFWYADEGLATVLEATSHGLVRAEVVNFVQHREVELPSSKSLLRVEHCVARPVGPEWVTPELVKAGTISYVEAEYPAKFLARATPEIEVAAGAHAVSGVEGTSGQSPIRCLHVPLRAKSLLAKKAEHGRRHDAAGRPPEHGWHARRFAVVEAAGRLDAEWRANSQASGTLDSPLGRSSNLRFDPTVSMLARSALIAGRGWAGRPGASRIRRLARIARRRA